MARELIARLRAGDRGVLGRTVSLVENGSPAASELLQRARRITNSVRVIGFTGSPGSGKSTLIDALIEELRRRELAVAVIAIDPSSPVSGGAVLGDRCRMNRHQKDDGVYIRSLSARGSVGGLSAGARRVVDLLKASAFDLILVETVGAGQSEVDISELADTCVVVCTPNSGDDIQAIKSGILEIADILVTNKADLADADRTVQQLTLAQHLPSNKAREVPVMATIATAGQGIVQLADYILRIPVHSKDSASLNQGPHIRKHIARAISRKLEEQLVTGDNPHFGELCDAVREGILDTDEAASQWLDKN